MHGSLFNGTHLVAKDQLKTHKCSEDWFNHPEH